METSTEVAGYIVLFFCLIQEERTRVFLTWPIADCRLLLCNSTTFVSIGRAIGPTVARQTVCTAWRTDTRRRGRASAVGYGAFFLFVRGAISSF